MLYLPDAFEPLTDEAWDEGRVASAIRKIVADAERAFDPDELWPHIDAAAGPPAKVLYGGASGVIWALDILRGRGHAEVGIDLAAAAERTLQRWREAPDFSEHAPVRTHASLYFGETGPLAVACRLAPSSELLAALFERTTSNLESEPNTVMDGLPGRMLVARMMLERTGEQRWADVWCRNAEVLWERRDGEGLWTVAPHGRSLGGAHGAATTALILLQGRDLLPDKPYEELMRTTAETHARYAVREDGLANWPMTVEKFPSLVDGDGQIRVQWCHGGAGVVTSAAACLDRELLLAGAELVWRAGPPSMEKGPGICHGTAGNGYALLKVFGRTRDELWLGRARQFAMHALDQVGRWRSRRGQGRYSLWSGDVGAAVYAADCIDARTAMPIIEYWDA